MTAHLTTFLRREIIVFDLIIEQFNGISNTEYSTISKPKILSNRCKIRMALVFLI